MDVQKFLEKVETYRQQNPQWRYGQALFNTLSMHNPVIADMVRGSQFDPYYVEEDSTTINLFLEYIQNNG